MKDTKRANAILDGAAAGPGELPNMTVRTPLGSADLVPFLRRDARLPDVELRDWEREPAALALSARRGWGIERVAHATGMDRDRLRELLAEHAPHLLPAPKPEEAPRGRPSTRLYGIATDPDLIRKKAPKMSIPWDVKERIDALDSAKDRAEGRVAAVLALHTPERRYTDSSGEVSYDTAEDAAAAFDIPLSAVHYFLVCAHCGAIEMGDGGGRDYRESLWPCATARGCGVTAAIGKKSTLTTVTEVAA
ncbi:hypothetical protein [Glycomyces artemisiae]|uniref:Uncharacterized protein n=1 Tax=Glycomyces artemisiae TaxID=1076443 RepID=A0A2T0UEY7_9ACTN|nr:hypothetical protein [Glycomyces artemisiae]PRY56483.1 hypothetical protein B0I28_109132 [Glycomyces artemisiae]